jgi:hypothetical protein
MPDEGAELIRELQQLRRGHGVNAPDVVDRVGPRLARICGLDVNGRDVINRERLVDRISRAVEDLPDETRVAVQAAFALQPASQERFLRDRMEWLGRRLGRDPRTAMRRVEAGLALLAERLLDLDELSDRSGTAWEDSNAYAPDGWYVSHSRSTLLLHVDPVQLIEARRIVSTRDGLQEVTMSWSVPSGTSAEEARFSVEVLYGGELIRDAASSTSTYWNGRLRLPHPLAVGERHEFQMRVTTVPLALLRPYYVLTPFRRTDEFELRAKFPQAQPPDLVWELAGVPFQLVDESRPVGDLREPDAVGEVFGAWRNLRQGLSYGLRWRWPTAGAESTGVAAH